MFYIFIIFLIAWMLLYHIFLEYANITVNMIVIAIFTVFELILCYIFNENILNIWMPFSIFIKIVPVIYEIKW
jgi:hypothetical protein